MSFLIILLKSIFMWLSKKKSISNTISRLISANKKIFLKNLVCLSLLIIKNPVIVILYIFQVRMLIFWVSTLVSLEIKLNLAIKARVIALILLAKSIKVLISLP